MVAAEVCLIIRTTRAGPATTLAAVEEMPVGCPQVEWAQVSAPVTQNKHINVGDLLPEFWKVDPKKEGDNYSLELGGLLFLTSARRTPISVQ